MSQLIYLAIFSPHRFEIFRAYNKRDSIKVNIAAEFASCEADIVRVDMHDAMDTTDLRFVVTVRDLAHVEAVLRTLRRTQPVLRAFRVLPQLA